ncbi:MAG: hypothetical protein PF569_10065 [Candidatus Woesearchaeota archaeon]|jgi:hypothetical protein|nr:hypothetical protein [Candidatus Woesearchaeota archaeon]
MLNNKKALGVVVAVSLLIVVSVTAVMSFNNWYGSYSSDMFAKAEDSASSNAITIKNVLVESNQLQIYAYTSSTYDFIDKIDVNGASCNLLGSDVVDVDLTQIDLDCSGISGQKNSMTLYTVSNIYKYEFFI